MSSQGSRRRLAFLRAELWNLSPVPVLCKALPRSLGSPAQTVPILLQIKAHS